MLELVEIQEVAGIVTATKDDVAAGRIVTERTQHFFHIVSLQDRLSSFRTTPLILWSALSLPCPTSMILNNDWLTLKR